MATKTVTQIQEAQTTILDALQTARAELQAFVVRRIDGAEKRTKAVFRFARTLSKRLGGGRRKARTK